MAQQELKKVIHEKNKSAPLPAGRGGARAGAGRKSGSGAFGEATVPMRVPMSLSDELGTILETFKEQIIAKKESAHKIAPLCSRALKNKANALIELAGQSPSGKPVDVLRMLASHPESCYAWRAVSEHAEWSIKSGDTVIIDRAAKAKSGCLAAFWSGESVELMRVELKEGGAIACKCGSKTFEIQGRTLDELQVWGVVVGITRKIDVLG